MSAKKPQYLSNFRKIKTLVLVDPDTLAIKNRQQGEITRYNLELRDTMLTSMMLMGMMLRGTMLRGTMLMGMMLMGTMLMGMFLRGTMLNVQC